MTVNHDEDGTVRVVRVRRFGRTPRLLDLQVRLRLMATWLGVTAVGVLPFVILGLWLRAFALGGALEAGLSITLLLVGMRVFAVTAQPRLERFFGRRRHDLVTEHETLAERSARLQPSEELGRAVDCFLRVLDRRLSALLIRDANGRFKMAHSAWGAVPTPPRRGTFIDEVARLSGEPITRDLAKERGDVEIERACVRWGAEYLLPLTNAGEVVGVLAVSPKQSGGDADVVELETLDRARVTITAAIVAASLYERSSTLGAQLEQKANARSIELAKTLRDLSGAEERLVRTEKLALLGEIVGGVGNDLAEQVGKVFAEVEPTRARATRLVEAAQASTNDSATRAHLEEIARDLAPILDALGEGARRANSIAQDLLRFAPQGGPGTGSAQREEARLDALTDATLALLGKQLGQVRIARAYDPKAPPITIEIGPIEQVILNLVLNALHAMKGRGILTLSSRYERDFVELSIADTGPGILPDVLPRIFEPFFSTKGASSGTGLGLWLSSGIVERHGGRILVETKPGLGTVFRVRLPISLG